VWNQHFEYTSDVVRGPDGPLVPNAERVVSPYETDARESRKRDTEWLGYKVHLTETCSEEEPVHLIVQAEITAATVQDVEETMPRLARFASSRPRARGAARR
jgi:transposase